MKSSGIKRGLAVAAISALAVTGVPAMASAVSINDAVGANGLRLYTDTANSSAFDGVNNTVHLLAGAGANVEQVRFEFGPVGTPTEIATVSRTNGAFSTEWAPPASVANSNNVPVRAIGLSSVGTPVAGATQAKGINLSTSAPATDIANPAGSNVPIFRQPYVSEPSQGGLNLTRNDVLGQITGTTSAPTGRVAVTGINPANGLSGLGSTTDGNPTNQSIMGDADADGIRTFTGAANFENYNFAGDVDEVIVQAEPGSTGGDVEVVNLVEQTITGVTAVADPANVVPGATSTGVVSVVDQNGDPIIGAQVVLDTDDDGIQDAGETVTYTNPEGEALFPGLAGSAAGTEYNVYVNTTDGNDFESAIDFARSFTVTAQAQALTALTLTSADGAAFDFDENDGDDLQVTVTDQNGAGIAGQQVQYSLAVAPFPTTPVTPTPAPMTGTATTNAQGVANIPFGGTVSGTYTLSAFVNQDGTPGQGPTDPSADNLVFKAGDSTLEFSEFPTANSIAGTTDTYDASLTLGDGTPLPGRSVAFTFARAAGGNAVVAANANQPAGTTRNGDLAATGTTGADGVASVAISDLATPVAAELGGMLDADTATNDIGNAAEDAEDLTVNFVIGASPNGADATIVVDSGGTGKPGEATDGDVTVTFDDDDDPLTDEVPLEGLGVVLTVDQAAFFTDGEVQDGAEGDDVTLDNDGQTITVVTDNTGTATFSTSIGRDEGFDDDGMVTATVTGTAGPDSDSDEIDYDSSDPINGGDVVLELSPDAIQDSGALPLAQAGDRDQVFFDLTTTDQFGNTVGSEDVDITTDGGAGTTVVPNPAQSDFDNTDGDFSVSSDDADDVVVTATWTTETLVLDAAGAATAGPDEELTDSAEAINFYEIDFANGTYTLNNNGAETQPVGSTVTEVYTALDQNGEPIENVEVQFFRAGPDSEGDGDGNSRSNTNEDGQAFYVFQGTQAGQATVTGVLRDDEFNGTVSTGDLVPEGQLTDTVNFGGVTPPGPVVDPNATLKGNNNGAKRNDKLRLRAVNGAAGATARLIQVRPGKRNIVVQEKTLNQRGNANFKVRDRNGRRFTKYIAIVQAQPDVNTRDRSNAKRVR